MAQELSDEEKAERKRRNQERKARKDQPAAEKPAPKKPSAKKAAEGAATAKADADHAVSGPDKVAKDQARATRQAANKAARLAAQTEKQAARMQRKTDRDAKAAEAAGHKAETKAESKVGAQKPGSNKANKPAKRDGKSKPGKPAAAPAPAFVALDQTPFNILIIGQNGRIAREAGIFAASLRSNAPDWRGELIVAEPQPEEAWAGSDTRMSAAERDLLSSFGARILPFTARHFGRAYPYGNKIEALSVLPANQPFVFFDSDTLVTGPLDRVPFDFSRPTASMRREGTWPEPPLYGPGYGDIWRSLYDRFGLDFDGSLDLGQPDEHWERYLYFNAGWFLGPDPAEFGRRFLEWSLAIRNEPGEALASQSLDPWLDQVTLPLVIHALGGGRPGPELAGLDGQITCHYRNLSLLYACESDTALAAMEGVLALPQVAAVLRGDAGYDRLFTAQEGVKTIRPMFANAAMPLKSKAIRQQLKKEKLWFGR